MFGNAYCWLTKYLTFLTLLCGIVANMYLGLKLVAAPSVVLNLYYFAIVTVAVTMLICETVNIRIKMTGAAPVVPMSSGKAPADAAEKPRSATLRSRSNVSLTVPDSTEVDRATTPRTRVRKTMTNPSIKTYAVGVMSLILYTCVMAMVTYLNATKPEEESNGY
jgi:hypothetical protein